MQNVSTKNIAIRPTRLVLTKKGLFLLMAAFLSLFLVLPSFTDGAQKRHQTSPKRKKASVQRTIVVNDANILVHQRRAEDLVASGDLRDALLIIHRMNDYAKEVLSVATAVKTRYEEAVRDPRTLQGEKEGLLVRLKRLDRLTERYTHYYEASMFNLGYLYSKLGEIQKARRYLVEFLQTAPYSRGHDSHWTKAKALLLELYKLEGEF